MSAAETWLLVAAIVAAVAALLALLAPPTIPARLATALGHAAVGLVAVGLLLALP